MATGDGAAASSGLTGIGSQLPWHLIPAFEPGETDLTDYGKRLEFLAGIWPAEHLSQLAPRAALQCKGSAFQKVLRLKPEQLKVNSVEGVKLLVTTLGGVWGKTTLEDKYGKFEKAIYGVSQRPDEANESYLARHDILFEDLIAQDASYEDMRAYILLRNSALSAEDKKRVIVEAQGNLKYATVTAAIRMLGAKFFHEVQGQQKNFKSKTYDVNYVQENEDEIYMSEEQHYTNVMEQGDLPEFLLDQMLNEGDEDALVVAQFEDALIDTIQNDGEMTAFMNTYVEARRRLTEKTKSRGFWPVRGKGAGRKGKGKPFFSRGRKPLAQRIAESECRICGQRGHWKAECPRRNQSSTASPMNPRAQAANVMVSVNDELPDDEADVFVMAELSPSMPDVLSSVCPLACPAPKQLFSLAMSKVSLADRFEAMNVRKSRAAQEQNLQGKSLEELGNMTVIFGQAKLGQKFSEVKEDAAYCKWFLRKWGDSEKAEHRALIHYLQLWVERQELEQGVTSGDKESPHGSNVASTAYPKAKAKMGATGGKSSKPMGVIDLEEEELEEEEWWDHITAASVENKNAERLNQLEGVLSEVVTQLKGMKAMRFGLKEGNLCYVDGRHKLYEMIFRYRPRNLWFSPKCKAWCKWNQFNRMRSPELARKIMEAREDDQIHLLLCEAVFAFQCIRGDVFHFHLEQPAGSDMLFQDPLQTIVNNTLKARCDLCTAGKLQHPHNHEYLQKGTQILTTSQIMHQYLETQKCNHSHKHAVVAGGYKDNHGTWKRISEYTELYTRVFGIRIARTLQASKQVNEKTISNVDLVFHESLEDSAEPEAKRRRLTSKVSNPPGYADAPASASADNVSVPAGNSASSEMVPSSASGVPVVDGPSLSHVLKQALNIAPRVGKLVLEGGELFDSLQAAFPERHLRVVELCKGTDRYRKPPVRLMSQEAPWRLTTGIHRHSLEPLPDGTWENWEKMSNRQMCSKAPPARLLVTLFGRDKGPIKHSLDASPDNSKRRRLSAPAEAFDPDAKTSPEMQPVTIDGEPSTSNPSISSPIQPTISSEDAVKTSSEPSTDIEQLQQSTIQHGPKFRQLSPQERHWISKIHHNLGHPGVAKLQAVLKMQGYDDRLIQGLQDFQCSTCHELQKPKIARPATIAEPREFNDCVGCDLITWTAKNGKTHQFFHCVDAATNFQTAQPVFRTDADSLFETLQDCWTSWAGPPKELVIDNESGLCSEQFTNLMQGMDTALRVIAGYAHWQLGKTERHGDIIQHMLDRFDQDHAIENEDQFKQGLRHVCNAKNALSRTKGYTPEILVLGKSRALPGSNCEDTPSASQYLADAASPEGVQFQRQLQLRESARKAFIEADHSERLRKAFLRRQRPHRGHFAGGTFVMFWRPGKGENPGQWTGPARVIIQENQSVVWVSHASRVYRVAPEHVRSLSENEAASSLESMLHEPMTMPEKSHGRGIFQYEDLTEVIPLASTGNLHINPSATDHASPGIAVENGDHQPDSEPGVPVPPESNGYTPTTPLSEASPSNHTPPPEATLEPTDPKDVPVPTDDELFLDDYWLCQNDKLIRVHQQPRTEAFSPVYMVDCPIDVLQLGSERNTIASSSGQPVWTHTDQWSEPNADWSSEQAWTGMTVFQVIPNGGALTNEVCDILHVATDQALEYEIFLTSEDINSLQEEPENFPTLLATAAKRQRPRKVIPLDAPVCVLLDFKGAFRGLLSTLVPRLLCQLEKRPVIAEIPFSEHWRTTRDLLLRGRKPENYELCDRHGHRLSEVAEVAEGGFPLELRHRQEFRVHKIFRDYAKCTLSQTVSSQTVHKTMVTFEVVEWQELMRVEVESHDAIVVKDVLDALHIAICAWLPEVSYSTGLPCPCGVVQSGHILELSKLLKEDTVFCDQKERSVETRPEEAKMIQQWRQLERSESEPGSESSSGSLPWPSSSTATWHFMYASPLEYRQQRIPQLNVVQELDVLPNALPWQVAVCTPNALIETLQERPVVLHVTAHSSALPPKMGEGGDSRRALLLEDAFGSGSLLDVKQLLELGPWQDVGLLVLLTCNSRQLVETLNCRFAVCCIHQVRDAAAREFCRTFYRCLAVHGALLDAFHAAQCAVRCSSDAGLRSEAENFHFVSRCSGDLLDLSRARSTADRSWVWPRSSRVEDFRCQVAQMVRMAKCLSNADGHRRVILLLGAPGSGKTATCREFCNHFSGPGRLFGGRVLFLQSQVLRGAASTAGGSMEDFLRQALTKISTTVQGQGLSLLVEKQELRLALEGALRLLESLRILLTSRCALGGGWDSLEHSKIVSEQIATLPSEDAAQLFQRRCVRRLYQEDFEAQRAQPCNGDTPRQPLNVSSAHELLLQSQLLKILDGVPGRIVGAAAMVDKDLSSLLKHPALLEPGNGSTGTMAAA
eukprot:s328_g8.t1